MIIDGQIDTSYDAEYLGAPTGLNWPAPIKKALAEYEKTWHKWADTETDMQTLIAQRDQAPSLDADLMRAAVREGKPDPGTPNQNKAERAVVYAKEATRQAAGTARAAADKIREDVAEHSTALLTEALAIERAQIATLIEEQLAAQQAWLTADDNARTIGSTINWILEHHPDTDLRKRRVEYYPTTVSWPSSHEHAQPLLTRTLQEIEATLTPQPRPARTSENTFSDERS